MGKTLLEELSAYKPTDKAEQEMQAGMMQFIEENEDCFERSNLAGHITGSALIIDAGKEITLLTHHFKLDKWLQLGGHADGDKDIRNVVLKEAQEESGLQDFSFYQDAIFDVDVHTIPQRKEVPEHLHYDVRFVLNTDSNTPLIQNHESKALKWIPLEKVSEYNSEESLLRMVRKCLNLLQN